MRTALIDADILRYEICYAAETGWKTITGEEDDLPPFDYVVSLLDMRLDHIKYTTESDYIRLYLTEGDCFRNHVAKTKPYKGQRPDKRPWHYHNITVYMKHHYPCKTVTWIEADDAMAIDQTEAEHTCQCGGDIRTPSYGYPCSLGCKPSMETIICSRDKDMRQVPGWYFSWELGNQPQIGPMLISEAGYLTMEDNNKLFGTGFVWFCAQLLMGDTADNIPGLPRYGPVRAYDVLHAATSKDDALQIVMDEYKKVFPETWEEYLEEQAILLWIVREFADGEPVVWKKS